MKIIEYNTGKDMKVRFLDTHGAIVHTRYAEFSSGGIKNPYHISTYGIGYVGLGEYSGYKNRKPTKQYDAWQSMLGRCYDEKYLEKYPTYKDAVACNEWHNFQNFAKWYDENYYKVGDERMHLDKDILFKGNKIYSPKTCVFVPETINCLILKNDAMRGKYPIGVTWCKRRKYFVARCSIGKGKTKYLGSFSDEVDAFNAYKNFKECHIKSVAESFKEYIPERLYVALNNYTVDIND